MISKISFYKRYRFFDLSKFQNPAMGCVYFNNGFAHHNFYVCVNGKQSKNPYYRYPLIDDSTMPMKTRIWSF